MKLLTQKNTLRLLALTGLFAIGAGVAVTHTAPANAPSVRALQVADGTESTGGGKPTKPNHRLMLGTVRALIADGSESTGKPPKPHNA